MRLTPTQREVLEMLEGGEEIVCDGLECWIGLRRIAARTVSRLLYMCLIREERMGGYRHYSINGTGRAALKDEAVIDRVHAALIRGGSYTETGELVTLEVTGKKI